MISKAEALKILEDIPHDESWIDAIASLWEFIEAAPEWTPFDEEHEPPKEGNYLATRATREEAYTTTLHWSDRWKNWGTTYGTPVDVTAWMPLPPPYRQDELE